jgi:hypothetical protein
MLREQGVTGLLYDCVRRSGMLYLEADAVCFDMHTTVDLFKKIDPDVQFIQCMCGQAYGNSYELIEGYWTARLAGIISAPRNIFVPRK